MSRQVATTNSESSEEEDDAAAEEETWEVGDCCWVCHMEDPLWTCPSCPRAYHVQCCFKHSKEPRVRYGIAAGLQAGERNAVELLECSECIVAKNTTIKLMKDLPEEEFKKIVKAVCETLRGFYIPNPYINVLDCEGPEYANDVKKVMDIGTLEKMVEDGEIKTLEGFLGELKWLEHNYIVREGQIADDSKEVKDLLGLCKKELVDISQCPNCYLNCQFSEPEEKWFVKACEPPHLLLTVKYEKQWWPAKLKFIDGDTKKVIVCYFGDQTKGNILLSQCRIMTNEYATSSLQKKGSIQLEAAKEELRLHLEALRETSGYGSDGVVLGEDARMLTVDSVKTELELMFPKIL